MKISSISPRRKRLGRIARDRPVKTSIYKKEDNWTKEIVKNRWNYWEDKANKESFVVTEDKTYSDDDYNNIVKNFPIVLTERQYGQLRNNRRMGVKYPFKMVSTWYTEITCETCTWRGTPRCPHGIKDTGKHPNGFCKQRVNWFTTMVALMGKFGGASFLQREKILENLDAEIEWRRLMRKTGEKEMPRELIDLMRLNMQSIEKFRKQEEGMKLKVEKRNVTPQQINDLVGAQIEKKINEKEELDRPYKIIKRAN